MYFRSMVIAPALGFSLASCFAQAPVRLTIVPGERVASVSPMLYGMMTEEINYSYDGGLYAEMVRNRSFAKSWDGLEHWSLEMQGEARAAMEPASDGPSAALPRSLKLTVTEASAGNEAGVANDGWWGMAVRPATTYRGSFYAKSQGVGPAHIRLIADATGAVLGEASVPLQDGGWQRYTYTLATRSAGKPSSANHLVISFAQPGSVKLQLVSLFPPTFDDTPNGNRPDLMQRMQAMKPAFLRLPGGNYLEGNTIQERFDWKKTIGPLVDRPGHQGPWGYASSDGLGLLEFLEWCEDLRMEPLLAIYAGYSLKGEHVVGADLAPFVQDALDEIEYITGDATTKWGALRVRDGHPQPFKLHYIEIGNEDQFDKSKSYDQRFAQMAAAIRGRHLQYKLIATTPVSMGAPDLVDDHYYESAEEFYSMVHHYDTMDRSGPKIMVGEWATRMGSPTPNFAGALGDAAWMTGMERNSDLIVMASYAPLLTNVNPGGMQWSTDLIGYDALSSYGSPSYWAQVLFANHIGDHTVKSTADHEERRFFWSSTVSADGKTLYLKLVNASDKPQDLTLDIRGMAAAAASVHVLHAANAWATNSLAQPDAIRPVDSTVKTQAGDWHYPLPANTIAVLDIPIH